MGLIVSISEKTVWSKLTLLEGGRMNMLTTCFSECASDSWFLYRTFFVREISVRVHDFFRI